MPTPAFFQRFGLYSDDHFFDADLCGRLRTAFRSGQRRMGTVGVRGGAEFVVDEAVRSARWVDIADDLAGEVRTRLLNAKPTLEAFYNVRLTGCEPPQFLAYASGDHYQAHRDSRPDEQASTVSRARQISAVVFLNDQSEERSPGDHYGGGALTFYGLVDQPSGDLLGIPLEPTAGLLMTFPAHLLHAVAPVTHGERYTIATWFF